MRGINVALNVLPISACPPFDTSGDGTVEISDVIAAVGAALFGCT